MRIIYSLCDFSGSWSAPYEKAGYDVRRIDLKHGQDVRLLKAPTERVYGVLMAPPCTMFAVSGARWRAAEKAEGTYDAKITEALSIVDACMRFALVTNPVFWVLENPIGTLRQFIGPPAMRFNPCDYGGYPGGENDNYTKQTCLWGKFKQPEVKPIPATDGSRLWATLGGKSDRTKELRSITPSGFAQAFYEANQ